MKILQHIPALQPTRLYDGQYAFDESAARLAVAAKTAPTPQHSATQQTLHVVVRRLNALVPHERPQRRLQPAVEDQEGLGGLADEEGFRGSPDELTFDPAEIDKPPPTK